MNKEEAVKIFDLVVKQGGLPQTLDKLVPLSFIGAAAVKFYQAKVKLMDQLGVTEEQRKATLADGQDAGEMLLNIEARIGELLPSAEEAVRLGGQKAGTPKGGGGSKVLPPDINSKRAQSARTIHRNPAAVKAVIAEAKENEDIPTKTAVLNKIRAEKAEEVAANLRKQRRAEAPPLLSEHLDWCIEMQHEINVRLSQIVHNKDQVQGQKMFKLAKLIRRAAEMIMQSSDQEKQEWQKLLTD